MRHFGLVIRWVSTYQLTRLKGSTHAAAISEKIYLEYYPEAPMNEKT
jgi:hypothetical protein